MSALLPNERLQQEDREIPPERAKVVVSLANLAMRPAATQDATPAEPAPVVEQVAVPKQFL